MSKGRAASSAATTPFTASGQSGSGRPTRGNLWTTLPLPAKIEIQVLLSRAGIRIERIVSHGQASPPGF